MLIKKSFCAFACCRLYEVVEYVYYRHINSSRRFAGWMSTGGPSLSGTHSAPLGAGSWSRWSTPWKTEIVGGVWLRCVWAGVWAWQCALKEYDRGMLTSDLLITVPIADRTIPPPSPATTTCAAASGRRHSVDRSWSAAGTSGLLSRNYAFTSAGSPALQNHKIRHLFWDWIILSFSEMSVFITLHLYILLMMYCSKIANVGRTVRPFIVTASIKMLVVSWVARLHHENVLIATKFDDTVVVWLLQIKMIWNIFYSWAFIQAMFWFDAWPPGFPLTSWGARYSGNLATKANNAPRFRIMKKGAEVFNCVWTLLTWVSRNRIDSGVCCYPGALSRTYTIHWTAV